MLRHRIQRINICCFLAFLFLPAALFAQHPKKVLKAYEAAEAAFMKHDFKTAHQQALKAITII